MFTTLRIFKTPPWQQQLAIGDKEVRIEAGDDALVLNTLSAANLDPRSPWFGRVDANDAGAFGHSFRWGGGCTDLLSGSQSESGAERGWMDVWRRFYARIG